MFKKYIRDLRKKRLTHFLKDLDPSYSGKPDFMLLKGKALPYFENFIGHDEFKKVRMYYGFDSLIPFRIFHRHSVMDYISKLRTIENAQYYIPGFKDLIHKIAKKVCNCPEHVDEIVKVKIFRLYFYLINSDARYFKCTKDKNTIYPNELFELFQDVLDTYGDSFFVRYDIVLYELNRLDTVELEKVLDFAELRFFNFKLVLRTYMNNVDPGFIADDVLSSNNKATSYSKEDLSSINLIFNSSLRFYTMDYFCIVSPSNFVDFLDIYRNYNHYKLEHSPEAHHYCGFVEFLRDNYLEVPTFDISTDTASDTVVEINVYDFFEFVDSKNFADNVSARQVITDYLESRPKPEPENFLRFSCLSTNSE